MNLIHIRRTALIGSGIVTTGHTIRMLVSEQVIESALHGLVHKLAHAGQVEKLLAELLQCENVPGAAIIGCVEQYQDCSIYVK